MSNKKLAWVDLGPALAAMRKEEDALALLEIEQAGARRWQWMLRIYNRYSRLRREREVRELSAVAARRRGLKP